MPKKKSKKFPNLIHVTHEGEGDGAYLNARADGVVGIEESGTEVAIYKLEKVGRVTISKKFEDR